MNAIPAAATAVAGVRRLAPQDLDEVVAIDAAMMGRGRRAYFERRLQAALREPALHVQFAAESGGQLTGYVLARVLEGEFGRSRPAVRLEAMGVRPALQGSGTGTRLLDALAEGARGRGLLEIRTQALWRNHAMLGFLDRAGFVLGRNNVIDCAVSDAPLGAAESAPVSSWEAGSGPEVDYGAPHGNDFEALARDTADVRALRREDLDEVVRIDRKRVGRERREYIGHLLDEALGDSGVRVSLAARIDGAVAGFLMARCDYGDFGRTEPVAVLDTIGVHPDFARRKVGIALLSQLFLNLHALRVERVETIVAPDNFTLLGFLYRAGFAPSQRLGFVRALD